MFNKFFDFIFFGIKNKTTCSEMDDEDVFFEKGVEWHEDYISQLVRKHEEKEQLRALCIEDAYYDDLYRSLERGEVCHI